MIPNSPADVAGLLPYSDYVIGSPEGLMRGENGLSEIIEDVRILHVVLVAYSAQVLLFTDTP